MITPMTLTNRLVGVLKLDAPAYEDIESDPRANTQALTIVILASLAAGLGAGLTLGFGGLVRVTIGALAGWVMWAGVTYLLGTRVWPEAQTRTDMGELLRVIGFSYAPHFFSIFGVLPGVGVLIRIAVNLWLLATTVVAVRQALDYRSTFRAFRVVVVGWLIFVAIAWAAGDGYPP
jgi:hypothetical protein